MAHTTRLRHTPTSSSSMATARIVQEIESITIGKPKKGLCPDKWLDTEFFIIKFK